KEGKKIPLVLLTPKQVFDKQLKMNKEKKGKEKKEEQEKEKEKEKEKKNFNFYARGHNLKRAILAKRPMLVILY
ncbi:MAG: hypothetical protein N7Q72_06470, partial [Spiroplasma sp. Tabriz.8]|nr:hypothetical protein [Spiroplasma sp. Tabriz.8]